MKSADALRQYDWDDVSLTLYAKTQRDVQSARLLDGKSF